MRLTVCIALALAALALAACGTAASARDATVERVVDGDTIVLAGGERVRLVQIDATELGQGECYSRKATSALRGLLPAGARVRVETDPRLDRVDEYGRTLAYVFRGGRNVNVQLVRRGAATVWFFRGERGRYADALLAAGRRARAERRGMWGACRVVWNPYAPATASG